MTRSTLLSKDADGLSLMEIVVGFGLITMMILSVILVLNGGLALIVRSEKTDAAYALAHKQMEAILARIYDPQEGDFDGRIPTATLYNFPPPPYPGNTGIPKLSLFVQVRSLNTRLWWIDVLTYDEQGKKVAELETVMKK